MKFSIEITPWVNEVKSYIKGERELNDVKKVIKSVDLSKISYADKVELSSLVDPRNEISEEVFKRQLDLYFSLLDSKKKTILPIFSEYVDYVCMQDAGSLSDKSFENLVSKLSKTKKENITEQMQNFIDRLPNCYKEDIDKMSNSRLNTLISILNNMGIGYADFPEECKGFVTELFKRCSVKTEIADKNKNSMQNLFRESPKKYYEAFNKSFAGADYYARWIDKPANKLHFKQMVDYARFQDAILERFKSSSALNTREFKRIAVAEKLPNIAWLVDDDGDIDYSKGVYLREERDYKNYAKKMSNIFVQMIQSETALVADKIQSREIKESDWTKFASTRQMNMRARRTDFYSNEKRALRNYSDFLVGLVHLDKLSGLSKEEIFRPVSEKVFGASEVKTQQTGVSKNNETPKPQKLQTKQELASEYMQMLQKEQAGSELRDEYLDEIDEATIASLYRKMNMNACDEYDIPDLQALCRKLKSEGKKCYDIENVIFDIEFRIAEQERD